MKRVFIFICLSLALFVCFASIMLKAASASDHMADITSHKSCQYCGMDREKFSHSRMLIEYDDGSIVATCSLHCVAVDMANNIGKTPKVIKVA